jgi:hypothetical protein
MSYFRHEPKGITSASLELSLLLKIVTYRGIYPDAELNRRNMPV